MDDFDAYTTHKYEPYKQPQPTTLQKKEWQGLTDREIADCEPGNVEGMRMLPYSFARAIEAKLKEKNNG